MIAIFKTEKESIEFSDLIHKLLVKNRKGYSAEKWSDINKSDNNELWCVKLPHDYKEIGLNIKGLELVEKLPEDWKNEESLTNI